MATQWVSETWPLVGFLRVSEAWPLSGFLRGFANFKFIFLSHFSSNFDRFGPYPAAFELNFPKHNYFFPF